MGDLEIVAVDISGRHEEKGRYVMVCAAVSARVSPGSLEKVFEIRQVPKVADVLDLNVVVDLISETADGLNGVLVVEPGDLYNMEEWRAKSILGRALKYPESLGELLAVRLAHHISISGRRLLARPLAL